MKKHISLYTITIVASLGGFLFGFDMAVVSGVLPFVKAQFGLTAAQEVLFVSSALVGCIIGVAFSGELSDRLGRRKPVATLSKEQISAIAADQEIADKLRIPAGSPLLFRKRFVFDTGERPIEYNLGFYKASSFVYTVESTR